MLPQNWQVLSVSDELVKFLSEALWINGRGHSTPPRHLAQSQPVVRVELCTEESLHCTGGPFEFRKALRGKASPFHGHENGSPVAAYLCGRDFTTITLCRDFSEGSAGTVVTQRVSRRFSIAAQEEVFSNRPSWRVIVRLRSYQRALLRILAGFDRHRRAAQSDSTFPSVGESRNIESANRRQHWRAISCPSVFVSRHRSLKAMRLSSRPCPAHKSHPDVM